MDEQKARRMLLRKLLASHAHRMQQGRFFSVQLGLVYPVGSRLQAYALPFVADGYFCGKGSFDQRVNMLTLQATAQPQRRLIAARLVPGFVGMAIVANAVWETTEKMAALSPQHLEGCLLASVPMLDDTALTARRHLATGICDFPQEGEIPDWDLDAVFQLLYTLDGIQQESPAASTQGEQPIMTVMGCEDSDAARIALPTRAQGVKQPATLLIL